MKTRGFTLVELIGVIALMGILAVIVGMAVKDTVNKNKNKANIASIEKFVEIVRQDKIENGVYADIHVTMDSNGIYYENNNNKHYIDYNGIEIENTNDGCLLLRLNSDGDYYIDKIKINGICYSGEKGNIKQMSCDESCT